MVQLISQPYSGSASTAEGLNFFIVLPRVGTISPWSSKATNIAQMCNLDRHVKRVERGQAYLVRTKDGKQLSEQEFRTIAVLVHDRMTQDVLNVIPDEKVIFKVYLLANLVLRRGRHTTRSGSGYKGQMTWTLGTRARFLYR